MFKLIILNFLAILITLNSVWADKKSDKKKLNSRFQELCGDSSHTTQEQAQQKEQYCKAADSSLKAAGTNDVLWKVYAGVGTVCTTACVLSFTSPVPYSDLACSGASVAGGVTDAVMTKQYTTALLSIAGIGVGVALKGGISGTKSVPVDTGMHDQLLDGMTKLKGPESDWGSCVAAAAATVSTYMKYDAMKKENKTAQENLDAVEKLKDIKAAPRLAGNSQFVPQQPHPSGGGPIQAGSTSPVQSPGGGPGSSSSAATADPCAQASATGSFRSGIQCSKAMSGAGTPSILSDPKFARDLKNTTSLTPDEFFRRAENPRSAIGSAGNSLGSDGGMKLSAALKQLEDHLSNSSEVPGAAYASGGASPGEGNGGSSGDANIAAMVAGLVDKLTPKDHEKSQDSSNTVTLDPSKIRSPAYAEDRTVSLFERVSYRYYKVQPRLAKTQLSK